MRPPQPDFRQPQSDADRQHERRNKDSLSARTLRGTQKRRDHSNKRKRVDVSSTKSILTQGLKSRYQNGKLIIANPTPSPSTTFETARSKNRSSQSRASDYNSATSTLRTIRQASNHSSSDESLLPANMSSQPLLQTAPGNTCPICTFNFTFEVLTVSRQAHCSPNQSRTQGLLRQRKNLPLMAEFHRHPRWSSRWSSQLR